MNARILIFLLLMSVPAFAQGFAGLGSDAAGFAMPVRGTALSFPADHGAHPRFRIEWWYVTANLKGADGRDYGAQWTLFRSALSPGDQPGWQSPQLWMGHAALTTPERHRAAERTGRGGIGQAGVSLAPFTAAIDDWSMVSQAAPTADPLSALQLKAAGQGFAYRLGLKATGPLVLHGEAGYSVKSLKGQASYYYSQPFYEVSGAITVDGRDIAVTGQAWFDHEWSSQPLTAEQLGWDWFSFHFASGEKLMGYRFRDGGTGYTAATWISADGRTETEPAGALDVTPLAWKEVSGHKVPIRWEVKLPARGLDVTTEPVNPDAWMDTQVAYWEGPVHVTGTHAGQGYVEMTGY